MKKLLVVLAMVSVLGLSGCNATRELAGGVIRGMATTADTAGRVLKAADQDLTEWGDDMDTRAVQRLNRKYEAGFVRR